MTKVEKEAELCGSRWRVIPSACTGCRKKSTTSKTEQVEDHRGRSHPARRHCAAALDKIQNAMLNIIGSTDSTRSNVTHSVQKIFSNSMTQNLKASRGFRAEPGSTFYQGGGSPRPGSYAKRMARSHAKLGEHEKYRWPYEKSEWHERMLRVGGGERVACGEGTKNIVCWQCGVVRMIKVVFGLQPFLSLIHISSITHDELKG